MTAWTDGGFWSAGWFPKVFRIPFDIAFADGSGRRLGGEVSDFLLAIRTQLEAIIPTQSGQHVTWLRDVANAGGNMYGQAGSEHAYCYDNQLRNQWFVFWHQFLKCRKCR